MTTPEFSHWTPDTPKKFVTIETTEYSCVYCGRGSDKKEEVFSGGACKNCGGPAREYVKTTELKSLVDTGSKIILFDSLDDKENTDRVIEDIKTKHNIEVVRFSSLVQSDMSVTERVELAKEAAESFGLVFIVASEKLNLAMGKIPTIAFSEAKDTQPVGVVKPIIFLSSMSDAKYAPRESKSIIAVSINDSNFNERDFYDRDAVLCVAENSQTDKIISLFKKSRGG